MKKLLIALMFLGLIGLTTNVIGGPEITEEKEIETVKGYCPFTKIAGEPVSCYECHEKKTWKIKEILPFESWIMPNHKASMILEDGLPVGVIKLHSIISMSDGDKINDFFQYLDSNHKEVKKVIIDIFSGGGAMFGGYQAVGVLKLWQSRGYIVETRLHGFAGSAAFFIFCVGDIRSVSPQAELMWHELITFSMFDISGPADKEDQAAVLRHLQDTANDMIAEISNLTKDELDSKIRKKEYWINGKEALEYGFANRLLGGHLKGSDKSKKSGVVLLVPAR